MNFIKQLIVVILGVLLLHSCGDTFSTVVDVDPPAFESQMTISSFVDGAESETFFFVGQNRSIFSTEELEDYALEEVNITVTNNSTSESRTAVAVSLLSGYNYSMSSGDFFVPGHEYTFDISHPSFSQSSTTLSYPELQDNLGNLVYNEDGGINLDGSEVSSLSIDIIDQPDVVNYYELEVSEAGQGTGFGNFYLETIDPVALKGSVNNNLLISDETFDGEQKTLKVTFNRFLYDPERGNGLSINWKSISRDAYEYGKSIRRYLDTGDTPFVSPVQVHSNVNNAIGIISFKSSANYLLAK